MNLYVSTNLEDCYIGESITNSKYNSIKKTRGWIKRIDNILLSVEKIFMFNEYNYSEKNAIEKSDLLLLINKQKSSKG
jgi:hypothetical protein